MAAQGGVGSRISKLTFLASLVGVAVLFWWLRLRHWYPHDEGTLAQAALRVASGQIPHRDFAYPYTGGDAVIHAALFSVSGPSLAGLRSGFAVIAILWLVAIADWFRHHLGDGGASVAVLLLGAWSVGMYFAAIPSWYVTMLVTGAMVLILRPNQQPVTGRHLMGAGLCLGLAFSIKITALFALVGLGSWLIVGATDGRHGARPWAVLLLLLALIGVFAVLGSALTARNVIHLAVPPLAVVFWGLAYEYRRWRRVGWSLEIRDMAPLAWVGGGFVAGAMPVLLWLAGTGALGDLIASLGSVGTLRSTFAAMPPPRVQSLLFALPVVVAVPALRFERPWRILALFVAVVLGLAWDVMGWYALVWQVLRGALPLGIVAMLLVDLDRRAGATGSFLVVVTVLGWMALSQFPFAAPIYFVYLVPIALLLAIGTVTWPLAGKRALVGLAAALILLGYSQELTSPPSSLGWRLHPTSSLAVLPGARGGLLVPREDSATYGRLLQILSDSVPPGPIWVGPDAPEVAFLAGRRDLNDSFFGFLRPARPRGPEAVGVAAKVVNRSPSFSPVLPPDSLSRWESQYAHQADVGAFTVLWGQVQCDDY